MEEINPWEKISVPKSTTAPSSYRVDGTHHYNFWWAVNHNGQLGFMVEFSCEMELRTPIPNLQAIEAKLSPNKKFLTFFLIDREIQKKFRILCHDLISDSQHVGIGNDKKLLENVISTFIRWQKLFEIKKIKSPSMPQKLGLLGELNCLCNFVAKHVGFRGAVDAWQGPKGHEQDFSINGHLIEVKAQLSSSDRIVKISSLEQLDTISGVIWLQHLGLSPTPIQDANTISINSLTQQIVRGLAGDNFGVDVFVDLLERQGFSIDNQYGDEHYNRPFRNTYLVDEDFPKITRGILGSSAIVKGNYSLNMSDLSSWIVKDTIVETRIFA